LPGDFEATTFKEKIYGHRLIILVAMRIGEGHNAHTGHSTFQ
jgi:hypothetical protein